MPRRLSSKKRKLLRVIKFSFAFYISYLVFFLYDYFTCNSEIKVCFYQTDLNIVFAILAGICYVINIAAQIQTLFIDEKRHSVFLYYRMLAGLMSIIILMILIITLINSGSQPNEFMTPSVDYE
jgi:magnesium-transporting ATPase (P-type)